MGGGEGLIFTPPPPNSFCFGIKIRSCFLAKLPSWLGNKMALLKILTLGKLTAMSRLGSKIRESSKGQLVTTPPTELWLPNLEVQTLKSELSGLSSESLIGGGRETCWEKDPNSGSSWLSCPVVPPPGYLLGSLVLPCQSKTGSLPPILVVSDFKKKLNSYDRF